MIDDDSHIVSNKDDFSLIIKKGSIKPNTQYRIIVPVIVIKGKPFASYLFVTLIDANNRAIKRYIRWIKEISQVKKNYEIIFHSTSEIKNFRLGFQANIKTPIKSEIEIKLPKQDEITVEETQNQREEYDHPDDFELAYYESNFDEDKLESKIVWLFGSPRSGTTWLGRDLLNHEDNAIWLEPKIANHFGWGKDPLDIETGTPIYKETEPEKKRQHSSYFFAPQFKNYWVKPLRRLILERSFAFSQSNEKNIIIKEPVTALNLDLITETLPKSKFLFLMRDGRDVVGSLLDRHKPNSWAHKRGDGLNPLETDEARERMIRYYSTRWVETIYQIYGAFENHNPDLRLMVKYEKVLLDSLNELKKIYHFLDINVSDGTLEEKIQSSSFKEISESQKGEGKFYRFGKAGIWRKTFSNREQEILNSIMGETLTKFEYQI